MANRRKAFVAQFIVLFFLFPLLSFAAGAGNEEDAAGDEPVVRTPSGALRGTTMTSRNGRTINSFRGIRYAQPPTGELRFKPPVAFTEKWNGIKNATADGASCPQATDFLTGPISEDCLFLNVYTTQLPNQETDPRRPVIVWFHHGGWYALSAQSSLAGPQYLMDEDITLVTVNYRLGALGFLSTGDSVVPGNNGLKDQVASLEWVRDNIAYFGGDPNSVTIYGYSAGGASVQYHLLSPLSSGLFHRAISGSGSSLSEWALTKDPKANLRKLAKFLNCPHDETVSSKIIIDCLRRKDANEIAKSFFLLSDEEYTPLFNTFFAPVVEAEGNSNRPFLTEDPTSLFRSGKFAQVPWITGTTNNEWMLMATEILANQSLVEELNENFEKLAPILFNYERNTTSSTRKSHKIKEFYFGKGEITQDSVQALTDAFTDYMFLVGADRSVKLFSKASTMPVYYYLFTYRGRYGHMPIKPDMDRPPGAVHHDDLIYVYYGNGIFPFFGSDYPEMLISQRLVKMWANFAKTGNPTPDPQPQKDDLLPTVWQPHTPSNLAYMEIGQDMKLKRALRQDRAALWDQIFPMEESA